MKEHVKILTGSSIIINRIAELLEQNNIPILIRDNVESARLAGFGAPQNDVELYVFQSDFSRAQSIIEAFNKEESH